MPTRNNSSARLTVLGAGTFTAGADVPVGRYVITAKAGESGNLSVIDPNATDPMSVNEVLGGADGFGVPSVTTTLAKGDQIQISGLAHVTFTPAVTKLRTWLGDGNWVVGLDIAPGRYVATPAHGQSGNFVVSSADPMSLGTNEILGGSAADGGVPDVTVTLAKGDQVQISGMSRVNFARK